MDRRVVGLVTDPDLPTEVVERIVDDLDRVLTEYVTDKVDWDLQIQSTALPLDEDGKIIVWRDSDRIKRENGWDLMVAITELTRRLDNQLVMSDVSISHKAAVISLPALGTVRLRHHTKNAIVRVLREMVEDDLQPDREVPRRSNPNSISPDKQTPVRQETIDESGAVSSYLALKGVRGRVRLLSGMVRVNRPWRMVPSLSSALAAAGAAAAFGIFYSNIWILADSLSPARLLLISVIAIMAMVAWLIVYNNLWERAKFHEVAQDAKLYNTATVATLIVGVTCIYMLLFVGAFFGAFIVIPAPYMETQLQHPVNWGAYAQLAWLATSMGITAGALGSSFESDAAVRAATYGKREQERHEKITGDEGANADSAPSSESGHDPEENTDSKQRPAAGSNDENASPG